MKLKNLDYLSPQITLFYYRNRRHATNLGAILTIILSIISLSYIIFLILSICNHDVNIFMYYRSYIPDLPYYYFNETTGIFHYFQIFDTKSRTYGKYDPKNVRIIMSRLYKTYQENKVNLYDNEHWVYDLCRQGIDNKYIDNDAFDEEKFNTFENSACLRFYYNNVNHTYIDIDDKNNFKNPFLLHGVGNDKNLYLETIIEKCDNSSITNKIFGNCGTQEEIDNYFGKYDSIYFQLVENKVDVDNYKKPVYQNIYGVGSSLNLDSVSINNINLSPYEIEVKKGSVFPRTKKISTYLFEDNRRATWESKSNKKILSIFDYWIQNSGQVIKGSYLSLYDILPNIGGFVQLFHFIFYIINFIYNQYITLVDCNKTLFRLTSVEDPRDKHIKKILFDDIVTIREEIKFKEDSRILEEMQKRDSIYITKRARQKKKSLKSENEGKKSISGEQSDNKNNLSNSNDMMNLGNNDSAMNNITVIKNIKGKHLNKNYSYSSNNINDINKINEKLTIQFSSQINDYLRYKNKNLKTEPLNSNVTSQFISFYNFIMSFFNHQYKKRIFFVLKIFRKKVLSEEHIFRSNIILYHLEKYFDIKETKKIDILDLYENM